jgi:pyruvate dehydrogenase E2 component (dihydrolipoamide acetyltransferase)
MPALSPTMREGTITNWAVKEGQKVQAGDLLAEIQTDKAVVGLETQEDGYVAKIIRQAGDEVIQVGELIAIIVEEEGNISKVATMNFSAAAAPEAPEAPEAPKEEVSKKESTSAAQPNVPHQMVLMPALSPTMTEGTIAQWNFKIGDKIESSDVLAEIQTDKAVVGLDVQDGGYLAKIFVSSNESVKVGSPIAVLVENESDVSAAFSANVASTKKQSKQPESSSTSTPTPSSVETIKTTSTPSSSSGRIKASPLAKKLAQEKGIDLTLVKGTGPEGRIIQQDVEGFKSIKKESSSTTVTPPPQPSSSSSVSKPITMPTKEVSTTGGDYTDIPVSQIRKVIAARLLESKTTIPHYYLAIDCQIDELMKVREKLNKEHGKSQNFKLSINDFIIKAAAKALLQVPQVNSSWKNTVIRQ